MNTEHLCESSFTLQLQHILVKEPRHLPLTEVSYPLLLLRIVRPSISSRVSPQKHLITCAESRTHRKHGELRETASRKVSSTASINYQFKLQAVLIIPSAVIKMMPRPIQGASHTLPLSTKSRITSPHGMMSNPRFEASKKWYRELRQSRSLLWERG